MRKFELTFSGRIPFKNYPLNQLFLVIYRQDEKPFIVRQEINYDTGKYHIATSGHLTEETFSLDTTFLAWEPIEMKITDTKKLWLLTPTLKRNKEWTFIDLLSGEEVLYLMEDEDYLKSIKEPDARWRLGDLYSVQIRVDNSGTMAITKVISVENDYINFVEFCAKYRDTYF